MSAQSSTELEQACREICPYCREAKRWVDSKKKGHVLRKREDTGEFVHDFIEGERVQHSYCHATKLRNASGR